MCPEAALTSAMSAFPACSGRGHHLLGAVACLAGRGRAMPGGLAGVAADPAEVLDGVAGDPMAEDLASVLIPAKSAVLVAGRASDRCRATWPAHCGISPDGRGGLGQRQRGVVVPPPGKIPVTAVPVVAPDVLTWAKTA
jgi:hypothetical protein